jgi:hypothetical protein
VINAINWIDLGGLPLLIFLLRLGAFSITGFLIQDIALMVCGQWSGRMGQRTRKGFTEKGEHVRRVRRPWGCVWNIRIDGQNYDETVPWKDVNLGKFILPRLRYDPGTKTTSFSVGSRRFCASRIIRKSSKRFLRKDHALLV